MVKRGAANKAFVGNKIGAISVAPTVGGVENRTMWVFRSRSRYP